MNWKACGRYLKERAVLAFDWSLAGAFFANAGICVFLIWKWWLG